MSEWNAEKARDLRRYIRMLRRDCDHVRYSCDDVDCCAGPIEKLSAAALGEIGRQDAEIQHLVQTHAEGCEEALCQVQDELREAEQRIKGLENELVNHRRADNALDPEYNPRRRPLGWP